MSDWQIQRVMAGNDVIYNGDADISLCILVRGDIANDPEFGPVFWDEYSAEEWLEQYSESA